MIRIPTIFAIFLQFISLQSSSQSPIRQANFERLTKHQAVLQFCTEVASGNPDLQLDTLGYSQKGQPIICVLSKNEHAAKTLRVLFIGGQHGNEASPREALLDFLDDFTHNRVNVDFSNLQFAIIPQVNPDGGDDYKRDNASGIDLNRDHVLLSAPENVALHTFIQGFNPHVTIDMHEYQPYRASWENWGYIRQFDIQLGGLTNMATDAGIREFQNKIALPQIKNELENAGMTFNEYLLGFLPENERMRRSTVDISDGRQSFGITGTMSFIIEGINGRTPIYKLERRVNAQKATVVALLLFFSKNTEKIVSMVGQARANLASAKPKTIPVRQEHFPDGSTTEYKLLDMKTQKDSTFVIRDFHPQVKSQLNIKPVKAFLIPKTDTTLVLLLKKHRIPFENQRKGNLNAHHYSISTINTDTIEEVPTRLPRVTEKKQKINRAEYLYVPTAGRHFLWLHLVLDPRSSLSLVNYPEFEYLLKENSVYSILSFQ
jgi:hypothetical protein